MEVIQEQTVYITINYILNNKISSAQQAVTVLYEIWNVVLNKAIIICHPILKIGDTALQFTLQISLV